jgi:hypothetical protein
MYSGINPVLSATSKDVRTQLTLLNLDLYVLSKIHQCNCLSFLCNIILSDAVDYSCLSWLHDARCPAYDYVTLLSEHCKSPCYLLSIHHHVTES